MKKITIAIDGHSSCGKSTMAKDLAREVGYVYVDTGAMYRSVTLYALRKGLFNDDGSVRTDALEAEMPHIRISFKFNPETGRPDTYLNGECVEQEIRSLEVSSHVSPIAAVPFVRTAMVAQQQQMGKDKGVVMDGRDIGTTVFPDAELKIFVTASAQVRLSLDFTQISPAIRSSVSVVVGSSHCLKTRLPSRTSIAAPPSHSMIRAYTPEMALATSARMLLADWEMVAL